MRRALVVVSIGLSAWYAVAAASQASPPASLPVTLREHLKNERFDLVSSIRGLPLGVRDALQALFESPMLDIAEPGAEFQASGVIGGARLPIRRLAAAGCSPDHHCLVYYERGGTTRTWVVTLFHWTPDATRFEWGGHARAGLQSIDDVRNAVLAGAVKGPVKSW